MQLAHELARRSAALRYEDIPAEAVHWARKWLRKYFPKGCGNGFARD